MYIQTKLMYINEGGRKKIHLIKFKSVLSAMHNKNALLLTVSNLTDLFKHNSKKDLSFMTHHKKDSTIKNDFFN